MISDRMLRRIIPSDSVVELLGDLIRALLAVFAVGLVTLYLVRHAAIARMMVDDFHMNDFGKFYYSARAFINGGNMYAPNPATAIPVSPTETREFGNLNPPHFHLVLLPLAAMAPLTALLVWALASLVSLAASVQLVTRELRIRWTPAGALWALAAALACSPTEAVVYTGQVTFLLLLPFTLAWAAARRRDWIKAAIHLGLIASLKPVFAVLGVVLLAQKQFKAIIVMTLVAAGCFVLGLAVFGWTAHRSWLNTLNDVEWTWAVMNASLHAPLARTLPDNPFFRPLVRAPELIGLLGSAASLVVALVGTAVAARDSARNQIDQAFAILTLTALLASPLGWIYYFWLALPPLIALWMTWPLRRRPTQRIVLMLAAAGLFWPLQATLAARDHALGGLTLGSIYSWTLLLIWMALLWPPPGAVTTAR